MTHPQTAQAVQIYGIHHPEKKIYPIRANPSGSMDVALQDQTTSIIPIYMMIEQGTFILAEPTASGSMDCIMDDVTDIESGTTLEFFATSGIKWLQPQVIEVNSGTNVITIDRHFQNIFESGTETIGYFGSINLAVSGTVDTPIIARAFNKDLDPINAEWDISEITLHIENGTAMADDSFGDIAKLKYGLQFRGTSDISKINSYNIKSNRDGITFANWSNYSVKAGGGTSFAWTFKKHLGGQGNLGVVNRWKPSVNSYLELVIMDNLEALDDVQIFLEGSVVLP